MGIEGERELFLLGTELYWGKDSEFVRCARKGFRDVGSNSGGGSGWDKSEIIVGLY